MSRGRNDKNRRKRRRRRGSGAGVVLTFLVLVVILAATITAMIVFFEIKDVYVTGETRYQESGILVAAQIEPGTNMFLFNKFSAINRIFAVHPYLDEIVIRRRFPDQVEILLTECIPVAVLEDEEAGLFIIDGKGKLLERIPENQPHDYCVIRGTSLEEPTVGKYAIFTQAEKEKPLFLVLNSGLDNDILQNIGEIEINEAYAISFTYLGRFSVKIGTTDDLEQKIRFMRQIVEEELAPSDRGVIDVTDTRTARFSPYSK